MFLIVGLYAVIELFAFTVVSLKFGRMFSFKEFEASRREVDLGGDPFGMGDVPARYRIRKEVIHPYLGYVHDPTVERSSPYGISDITPIQHKASDRVVIGIFGGSFAEDFADAAAALTERLQPYFPGKEFTIVKAAIGGYKQPQQLMAFNYFTALGGEFDIVINLDGFNEIALPSLENIPHTNPFFPRQWHLRLRMLPDTELLSTIGRIKFLDAAASEWARIFSRPPLRYSVSLNTIWRVGDQLLHLQAMKERARLPQLTSEDGNYASTGPAAAFADEGDMYAALGRVWAESSYQMHALARARDIRYFHFLQPNQYLEGTKPMERAERDVAIRSDHPYGASVNKGYRVLRNLGGGLRARGVNFVDLTDVYAETRDVVYRDNCCHVNAKGRDLVAAAIARTIAESMRQQNP